jgi:hypothetical protein
LAELRVQRRHDFHYARVLYSSLRPRAETSRPLFDRSARAWGFQELSLVVVVVGMSTFALFLRLLSILLLLPLLLLLQTFT